MDSDELRAVQQPLKDAYREHPEQAVVTLRAQGQLDDQEISCSVATGQALAVAGLHPATGGDGSLACSGDMLLQTLIRLTERYCVVYQTPAHPAQLAVSARTTAEV